MTSSVGIQPPVRQEDEQAVRTTAVFDLDGTLLDGDSTGFWMLALLTRSFIRGAVALLIAPLAGTLLLFPRLRRYGASALLWIATVGLDKKGLHQSLDDFVAGFRTKSSRLKWKDGGIATLERHLAEGHRVVVVTAAPLILAEALLSPWSRCGVFGSSLKRFAGGWILERHCRGEEKCRVLAENGYPAHWAFAYTDSRDDRPLLVRAEHPFVVNARPRTIKALRESGIGSIEGLVW
jgi:phosphatidylglycerophosphatase C